MAANNASSATSTSTDNTVTVTITAPQTTTLTVTLLSRDAKYKNEFGLFLVDDAAGRIGNVMPGDLGYARAALSRTKAVFISNDRAGAKRTVTLPAGGFYGMYLIQNATHSTFLARNPENRLGRGPLMFFSFAAANPDRIAHVRRTSTRYAFEDVTFGGDRDFNDLVVEIRAQAAAKILPLARG